MLRKKRLDVRTYKCIIQFDVIFFPAIRNLVGKRDKIEFAQTVTRYDRKFKVRHFAAIRRQDCNNAYCAKLFFRFLGH